MTDKGILQHPSTPEHEIDLRFPAEMALKESLPQLLEILMEFGFDCQCDDFKKTIQSLNYYDLDKNDWIELIFKNIGKKTKTMTSNKNKFIKYWKKIA